LSAGRPFAAAAVAVGANSLSLELLSLPGAQVCRSSRVRLLLHTAAIVPGWLWFIVEVRRLDLKVRRDHSSRIRKALGWSLNAAGWVLVGAGFSVLGPGAIVNADLFQKSPPRRSRNGIYRLLSQPIYTGYGLMLLGRGVTRGSAGLAAVGPWLSVILLAVQAPTEDLVFERNRRSSLAPALHLTK